MSRTERWAVTLLAVAAVLLAGMCILIANGIPSP